MTQESKARLRQQYATLNLVALLRQKQRLLVVLWKLAAGEPTEQETAQTGAASS